MGGGKGVHPSRDDVLNQWQTKEKSRKEALERGRTGHGLLHGMYMSYHVIALSGADRVITQTTKKKRAKIKKGKKTGFVTIDYSFLLRVI